MSIAWESELANFLNDLSAVQQETLQVLVRKRELLVAADGEGLAAVAKQEESLVGKLDGCLQRRQELLERAASEGLPAENLRALAGALPGGGAKRELADGLRQARHRARLLQHQSLANWVLAQRTLLHLAQVLEIIATGGKMQPTYSKDDRLAGSGALVDREV